MRTRFFLDSFASSPSLKTLDFLPFPPPHLPAPDLSSFDDLRCFSQVSSLNISPEIERFSVDEALSKFFSDVLPRHIDQQPAEDVTSEIADTISCDEKGLENQQHPCYKAGDTKITRGKFDVNLDNAANNNFAIVQFETPELHISLEDTCVLHEEKMQFFFEVADAEVCPDLIDFSLAVKQMTEIQKSIFFIEDFSVKYQQEQKSDFFEDGSLVGGHIPSKLRTFPLLEVDETSMGINSYISQDQHILFESIEPQPWMQKEDELMCDAKELLLSTEFKILEDLLNHHSIPCLKVEVMCASFASEVDIIKVIEHQITDATQESYMGLADGHSFTTMSPLAFELFQFFNINTSHFLEVFSDTETFREGGCCEQMFGDTASSAFNDLIVTHELTLRDDSFKALPVPIISDHEKLPSVQVVVEDILLKLKLQPSYTSDDIYLDWHLLEEDISSHNINTLKMFEEIDIYCCSADMNFCDSGMVILDFVFSDALPNDENTKENIEELNIQVNAPPGGNFMDPVCHGAASNKRDNISQKMESAEASFDSKAKRAPQFVESMSQFNDLDFLLNPLEATYVKKQKPADRRLEEDYALPRVPTKGSTEASDSGEIQWQNLDIELHPKGDDHSTSLLNESSKNLEELYSVPVEGKNSIESVEANHVAMTSSFPLQVPSVMELTKVSTSTSSLPKAIIIVNTQNVDTEMIISRRSTYQRILALENEGVQVVERDLNLPVDVIVSAAVCLVLYDSKNIGRKTTSPHDAPSFLPSCVENIAANVLTTLSFAFNSCILVSVVPKSHTCVFCFSRVVFVNSVQSRHRAKEITPFYYSCMWVPSVGMLVYWSAGIRNRSVNINLQITWVQLHNFSCTACLSCETLSVIFFFTTATHGSYRSPSLEYFVFWCGN